MTLTFFGHAAFKAQNDLSGQYDGHVLVYLLAWLWLLTQNVSIFKNLIGFLNFENQNVFQTILSNFVA